MNRTVLLHHIGGAGTSVARAKVTLLALREMCDNDDLSELLKSTIELCVRYAETVVEFMEVCPKPGEAVGDRCREVDSVRHHIHTATDDALCILARNLTVAGKGGSWIRNYPHRAARGALAVQIAYQALQEEVANG